MTRMRVGDGDDRPLLAAAGGQAAILGGEVGALGARGGLGGLDQRRAQPGVALAGPAAQALAGALVVAGAQPAQEARCPARGEARACPAPISATMISAIRRPTPGIVVQPRRASSSKGRIALRDLGAQLARSRRPESRCAPAAGDQEALVRRRTARPAPAPARAASSRSRPCASSASAAGSVVPGDQRRSIARRRDADHVAWRRPPA